MREGIMRRPKENEPCELRKAGVITCRGCQEKCPWRDKRKKKNKPLNFKGGKMRETSKCENPDENGEGKGRSECHNPAGCKCGSRNNPCPSCRSKTGSKPAGSEPADDS